MGNVTRDYIPETDDRARAEHAARIENASHSFSNVSGMPGYGQQPSLWPDGSDYNAPPDHVHAADAWRDSMLTKLDRIILLLETLVDDPQLIKDKALLHRLANPGDARDA